MLEVEVPFDPHWLGETFVCDDGPERRTPAGLYLPRSAWNDECSALAPGAFTGLVREHCGNLHPYFFEFVRIETTPREEKC